MMRTVRLGYRLWRIESLGVLLGSLAPLGCGSSAPATTSTTTTQAGAGNQASSRTGGTSIGGTSIGGTTTNGSGPVAPFKKLSVGYSGACVIDAKDSVACWGANPYGETGETAGFTSTLKLVAGMPPATQVVSASTHTCALTAAGDVYCWGANDFGQLGHAPGTGGDATCSGSGFPLACHPAPVKVEGLPAATAIATAATASPARVCALVEGGRAYCWGYTPNLTARGAVACGTSQSQYCLNVATEEAGVSGLTAIGVGPYHTCGNGPSGLVCWGDNACFEVAKDTCPGNKCTTPIARAEVGTVAAPPSLGVNTTCVLTESGEVACVGRNDYAQLAHPPGTGGDATCNTGIACNPSVTSNSALTGALALSPSSEWTWCAIAKDRSVLCWGSNDTDNLGHAAGTQGDTTCGFIACNPTPTAVPGVVGAKAVAAGHWTSCALDQEGALWCWGATPGKAPSRIAP